MTIARFYSLDASQFGSDLNEEKADLGSGNTSVLVF